MLLKIVGSSIKMQARNNPTKMVRKTSVFPKEALQKGKIATGFVTIQEKKLNVNANFSAGNIKPF